MKTNTPSKRAHYHNKRTRAMTPPRVAARLEGVVKNAGTKPKKKAPRSAAKKKRT